MRGDGCHPNSNPVANAKDGDVTGDRELRALVLSVYEELPRALALDGKQEPTRTRTPNTAYQVRQTQLSLRMAEFKVAAGLNAAKFYT